LTFVLAAPTVADETQPAESARAEAPPDAAAPDTAEAAADATAPESRPAETPADAATSPGPDLHTIPAPPQPLPPVFTWRGAAWFAGGAVTALAAHESCHLVANLALGNRPGFEPVTFMGFIPYFAIVPSIHCEGGDCTKRNGEHFWAGRPGLYTIVSAGIQCQQYEDEIILSQRPGLRMDSAPFRKGMLTFNTLLSIGYVIANWTGVEPTDGDIRGIHRDGGAPRFLVSSMIIGIAAVDIARYYYPHARWLTWLNRVAKLSVTGIAFAM
jgi:hypothetical protein